MLNLYRPSLRATGAILVLGAWVVSLGWLGVRRLERNDDTNLSNQASLRLAPGTAWYAVYSGQTQVGNAAITLDTLSPGYGISQAFVLETPEGDGMIRATRRVETRLSATLNVEQIHSHYSRSGRQADWAVDFYGDTMRAHFTSPTQRTQGHSFFAEAPVTAAAIPYRLALGGDLVHGRQHSATLIDGWPAAGVATTMSVGSDSMISYADSSATALDDVRYIAVHTDSARSHAVVINGASGPRRVWIDGRGTILGIETPLGTRWVRTDFDLSDLEFRRELPSHTAAILAAMPRLARFSAAPAFADTGTQERRFLVMHRDNSPVDTALLRWFGGGRQEVRGDTIIVRAMPELQPGDSEGQAAIDPLIQQDANAVITRQRLMLEAPLDVAHMEAFVAAFHRAFAVDSSETAAEDALGTLGQRRGQPDGLARLFVALVRAAGGSARYVTGVYPGSGRLLTHAWAEVWQPGNGWCAVDPAAGRITATTGLIRLAFAGSTRPDEMMSLVANARLVPIARMEQP